MVSRLPGHVTYGNSCLTGLTNKAGEMFFYPTAMPALIIMAGGAGLEPAAPGKGDRCSTSRATLPEKSK